MRTKGWQRGFTSISLVAVALARLIPAVLTGLQIFLGVLGMLVMITLHWIFAVFVAPKITGCSGTAQEITAKQDIARLMQALKLYRQDNQCYPATEQGLQALAILPTAAPFPPNWKAGGYVEFLPEDPWGNPYQYLNPGVRGEIDIFSFGADDVPGGEGNDTDIRLLTGTV